MNPHPHPQISLADLPDSSQPCMDFLDSAWFNTPRGPTRQFPTPECVRSVSRPGSHPPPVRFEELGLFVKFGCEVSTSEAINLWALRQTLQDRVPVPEVYGWRSVKQEGKPDDVYIYMQLIQGPTLQERWSTLSSTEKQTIAGDLRAMVSCFRTLHTNEPEQVIGSICHGPVLDRCIGCLPLLRPFSSRKEFHDWLSWSWRRYAPDPQSIEDPWRDALPDDGAPVFTHGDLHPTNIIVTETSPVKVVAIVDWEQGGWYPDYWEYCKARYRVSPEEEWSDCIHAFLDPYEATFEAFEFYTTTLGLT